MTTPEDQLEAAPPPPAETVSPHLLEALICPASGARLEYDRARGELVSRAARLAYPIRSGIPIMLIDDARHLDD